MKRMKDPFVSIFILNYNNKSDTVEAIDSVNNLSYKHKEIILVQNGSTVDVCTFFKEKYPEIRHIILPVNAGFTGGFNEAIKKIVSPKTDYVLFVSNDVTVEKDFLNKIIPKAEENTSAGLVCPTVLYYGKRDTLWCAGGFYNHILGKNKMRGTGHLFDKKYAHDCFVDWASFCIILIKKEVFEKIGLLDEDFFLSNEDLDFCLRAQKNRFKIYYCHDAKAYHKVAVDLGGLHNPLYMYYQVRNTPLCHKKNLPLSSYYISLLNYLCVSIPHRIWDLITNHESSKIKYIFMGLIDFFKNNFRQGVLSDKIIKELREKRNSKKRIGIHARYIQGPRTGIGNYTYNLINSLSQTHKNHVYILYEREELPFVSFKDKNIEYKNIPSCQNNRYLRIFWEQIFFSRKIKHDLINVFHGPSFMLPICKTGKSVITVHDLTFLHFPKGFNLSTKLYYALFFRRSLHIADMIIADSYSTKNDLMNYYHIPEHKVKVIYLGVDDIFKQMKDKKVLKVVQEKYSLPEKYFLFVGLLSPRKNIRGALRAFAQLNTSHKFVIVGNKGWLYEPIFQLITDLHIEEKVICTGYADDADLPAIYANAEVLIFPSFYEGFGLPILEAMACGCPVITSNVSSMPEVAGNAALFVNPNNIEDIKEAMVKIMTDKKIKEDLICKGYKNVKRFSLERMAKETVDIYEQLANQ